MSESMPRPPPQPPARANGGWVGRVALPALLLVVALYWTWFGLHGRSIRTDDGISLLAAAGIRMHGFPILPSGAIYARAYLAHYAVALSTMVFGVNDVGIALPAFVAALGTVALTFGLARRTLGSDVGGVLAAGLVAASSAQTEYAVSPRMYGPLTFFAAWASYAAFRGFVEGERAQRGWCVAAIALGLQCERGTATVLLALPVAWLLLGPPSARERWRGRLGWGLPEVAAGLVLVASVALIEWHPAHVVRPLVVEAGAVADSIGFSVAPKRILWHLIHMDSLLPGTLGLAVLATFTAFGGDHRLRYVAALCWLPFAMVACLLVDAGQRMVLFLLPVYATLVVAGARALGRAVVGRDARVIGLAAVSAVVYGGTYAAAITTPTRARSVYSGGWWLPDESREGDPETAVELRALRPKIAATDLVISSNPWVTDYYLDHTDGLLRQRTGKHHVYSAFASPTDEYFGLPIYDDFSKIQAVIKDLRPGQNLWVLRDFKSDEFTSVPFRHALSQVAQRVNKSRRIRIYRVTGPPAGPAGSGVAPAQ